MAGEGGMNYYERHIGDYLKNTAHLSLLEHGIYTRLLDVYYTREDGIPVDQVERLIGVRSKDERKALGDVLDEFFTVEDEVLRQDRCDKEIARYQDKQLKAKASAYARWAHTERNANAMRTHTEGNALQTPDTRHQTPDKGVGIREVVPRTPADEACVRMKAAGLQAVNPSHPKLVALLQAGITPEELADAAVDAVAKGKPFAYALATAEGRRRDAATQPLPDKPGPTVPARAGPDPTLARMNAERAEWKPPPAEVKALLAETAKRLKGAIA